MNTSISIKQTKFVNKEIKNINNSVKYGRIQKKVEKIIKDEFLKVGNVRIF